MRSKLLAAVLACSAVFGLASCGAMLPESSSETETTTGTAAQRVIETTKTATMGDDYDEDDEDYEGYTTTRAILRLIQDINKRLGITAIIITHEMSVIEEICSHVAILDHGKVAETGTVEDIFSNPKTEAGRRLVYPEGAVIDQFPVHRVVRVVFNGGSSYEPLIASLAIDCGVKVNILGADTRNIDGKAFGSMLLGLPEDPAEAAKALAYIRSQPNVTAEEVPDYHA